MLPTTSGIGIVCGAGASATTMSTALPFATLVPAAGSCSSTVPGGRLSVARVVTSPSSSPASASAVSACDRLFSRSAGTSTGSGPLLTTIVTVWPSFSRDPAVGCWRMTLPVVASLNSSSTLTSNLKRPSSCLASSTFNPTTRGTIASCPPRLTKRITSLPLVASVPSAGSVRMAKPGATSGSFSSLTRTVKPASSRIPLAVASSWLRTDGTSTFAARPTSVNR